VPTLTVGALVSTAQAIAEALVRGLPQVVVLAADASPPVPAVPRTPLGRALAVVVVALGAALVLVPLGIVVNEALRRRAARLCLWCAAGGHGPDAAFCRDCGRRLP
jgi:hypothetical protein